MIYQPLPALTPPHRANTGRDGDPVTRWATFLPRLTALFEVVRCIMDHLKFLAHVTAPQHRDGWG
jgi:hypothetical protein